MNKSELIAAIVEETKFDKKEAEAFLKSFTENVAKSLEKGEDVQLIGFGTFSVVERAARSGRNPKTGETITISASKLPKFKPGSALKARVNK